ncbi:MAG: glycosyltransferase family 39 protein [Candidatus Omnitrophica bacterium]|nr:glycosyltransferase family 39 protein [Candidatus Omnitrophota bacterium]MDD5513226.1 glycosyltransferase family 39 protein [Candidatus Omnitrophota bacterium]
MAEKSEKNFTVLFFLVFLAAALIRIVYFFYLKESIFFGHLVIDELTYDRWAMSILSPGGLLGSQVFWQAPFYAYFLALVYYLGGHELITIRLVQILLGLANCIFIFHIARAVFGRVSGIIALLLAAFYGVFIFYEGQVLNITLGLFLNLSFLLILLEAYNRKKNLIYFLAGLCLGLSAITRPTILIFLPFLLLWLARYAEPRSFRRIAAYFGSLLLGVVLLIGMTTARNYFLSGKLVPISTYGGINFYIGNNQDYDLTVRIQPGVEFVHFASASLRERSLEPRSPEASRFWYEKAFGYIKGHPRQYARLILKKVYLFWNGFEIPRYLDYYLVEKFVPVLKWGVVRFWMISLFSLLGIGIALSGIWKKTINRPERVSLLLLYVFSQFLVSVLYFITSPYRLSAVCVLIIFAAFFLERAAGLVKSRNYRMLGVLLGAAAIIGWVVNSNFYGNLGKNDALDNRILCSVFAQENDLPKAISYGEKAVSGAPYIPESWYCLAEAYLKAGRLDQAERACRQAISRGYRMSDIYLLLGDILKQKGLEAEAAAEYQRAQEIEKAASNIQQIF